MSFKIGLIGKPNAGKSTLFSAITATEVEIANYPFTTVSPNIGTSFIIRRCPEEIIGKKCNPNHGSCSNGNRYIPVQIVDVPGLIEGASEGKGMGNQFLQSITDASALMLVFDMNEASKTGDFGLSVHKEINDIKEELIKWASSIIARDWERFAKKADSLNEKVEKQLSRKIGSLGMDEKHIHEIMSAGSLPQKLSLWSDDDFRTFADIMFSRIKAIVPVANKADLVSQDKLSALQNIDIKAFPVSAEYELAIQRALTHGLITSRLPPFNATQKATQKQVEVLKHIEDFISSGIVARPFHILGEIVEKILKLIVVYPVYDDSTWTDKAGNVLPDAFLLQEGSTPLDLAYMVHTDIGEGFIRAVDCKSKMIIGKDHPLKDGDVVRIISKS